MIRAKMQVDSVVSYESTINEKYSENIKLRAVYSSDPNSENYSWSKFTPSGEVNLSVTNPAVWGKFQVGKEYYIDFTEVGVINEAS